MRDDNEPAAVKILDDYENFYKLDPAGIIGLTEQFPQQCRTSIELGSKFVSDNSLPGRPVDNVILCGMGGSAIGGDLLQSLMIAYGTVPFSVCRAYDLPAWVTRNTLVLVASYSGNTEEALATYEEARTVGATIACVTNGGELASRARNHGVPVCMVPNGQPPRTATGYMLFPFLVYLVRIGLLDQAVERMLEPMMVGIEGAASRFVAAVPVSQNPAKLLAINLHGTLPVVYGAQGYLSALALRWKSQFNENAKHQAFSYAIPEQGHNEILGWESCQELAPRWSVIYLRDTDERAEESRIGKRVKITKQIIGTAAQQCEFWTEGASLLERIFSLFVLGDFASVYLGYLNGKDPNDISGIDTLKRELAK